MKRVQAEQKNQNRSFFWCALLFFAVCFFAYGRITHASAAGSATNTFVTETQDPSEPEEKVTVAGRKIWDDDKDAAGVRPRSVTVYIYQNDKKLRMLVITENDDWKWSVTLPKYDQNGREIMYRVEEKAVANYKTKINGYNITNTYIGKKKPKKDTVTQDKDQNPPETLEDQSPSSSSAAQTGDASDWKFWYGLMLVSLLVFRQLFYRVVSGRWKWKKEG